MEIWKTIVEYENYYEVSNLGKVKSLKNYKDKLLTSISSNQNYQCIYLYKNKIKKHFRIHRLVALAFIPNPKNKSQVNHKNGDKTNNCVDNLEWCTGKENTIHAHRTGLVKKKIGKNNHRSKPIIQYDLNENFIKEWENARQAQSLGFTNSGISRCCNGLLPHYK